MIQGTGGPLAAAVSSGDVGTVRALLAAVSRIGQRGCVVVKRPWQVVPHLVGGNIERCDDLLETGRPENARFPYARSRHARESKTRHNRVYLLSIEIIV